MRAMPDSHRCRSSALTASNSASSVSGSYEFRGNLGVMDITRRGTTVLQWRLNPKLEQRQVWLEAPEVLEVTFDNPAPWFDGKAISNWVLSLFAHPVCAALENGQPC